MNAGKGIAMLSAALAFGIVYASQNGWPKGLTALVVLDAVILLFYVWLCWYNRRFIKNLASMSPADQHSIVEKMPPLVKDALNRELKN